MDSDEGVIDRQVWWDGYEEEEEIGLGGEGWKELIRGDDSVSSRDCAIYTDSKSRSAVRTYEYFAYTYGLVKLLVQHKS